MNKTASKITFSFLLLAIMGCSQKKTTGSPAGYDLNNPFVFKMPPVLSEISGITFKNGQPDTIYAQQDEEGKLFYFHLGDKELRHSKFFRRGDFEDLTILNGFVIMLRSDGTLFTFPLNEIYNRDAGNVNELPVLSGGEYEGLYGDEKTSELYVLCKSCSVDRGQQTASGQVFYAGHDGKLTSKSVFFIDTKRIAALAGLKKINFRPSALAKNPLTGDWFILSSVNKLLVLADAQWQATAAFNLNPAVFTQPEGISFDSYGNLYISNEVGGGSSGTVLEFQYHKNNHK